MQADNSSLRPAFVKTGITPDEYDQMRETLGVGDTPPAGGVFHAAAVGEDGKIEFSRYGTRVNRPRPGAKR